MTSESESVKPVIVLGAGGHARVLVEALRLGGREILGLTSAGDAEAVDDVAVLGDDGVLNDYSPARVELVNGIGALPDKPLRYQLEQRMIERGFVFARVVHPAAVIATGVELGAGAQIMAGAIIQPGTRIGVSCVVNTGAIVDHDCTINDHCHIAPGATLSGGVTVGEGTHIGTGAAIIHSISIGRDCIVAAGATVYRDLADGSRYLSGADSSGVG